MTTGRKSIFQRNYLAAARNISTAWYRRWREQRRRRKSYGAQREHQGGSAVRNFGSSSDLAAELNRQAREIAVLTKRVEELKRLMIDRDMLTLELAKQQREESKTQ